MPFSTPRKFPSRTSTKKTSDIQEGSQLVTIARFVHSLMRATEDADDLPESSASRSGILAHGVWHIATTAKGTRPWLLVMKEAGGKMADIANFFIELDGSTTYQTTRSAP